MLSEASMIAMETVGWIVLVAFAGVSTAVARRRRHAADGRP